jgi:hypothetical protein
MQCNAMSFELPAILSKTNLELTEPERPLDLSNHGVSPVSVEGVVYILDDKEAEKAPVTTSTSMSYHPVSVIFFWRYVDSINFGYAKLQGIEKDLHMTGNDFNASLLVQMVFLCSFEIPSNLMIKRVRLPLWLGTLSLGWGFMTFGQGLVHSYSGLLVLRSFLGAFEPGLIPGT